MGLDTATAHKGLTPGLETSGSSGSSLAGKPALDRGCADMGQLLPRIPMDSGSPQNGQQQAQIQPWAQTNLKNCTFPAAIWPLLLGGLMLAGKNEMGQD